MDWSWDPRLLTPGLGHRIPEAGAAEHTLARHQRRDGSVQGSTKAFEEQKNHKMLDLPLLAPRFPSLQGGFKHVCCRNL